MYNVVHKLVFLLLYIHYYYCTIGYESTCGTI
jgi:hypothetical protein